MRANGLRRLVVVDDDGRLAGIATMEDLLELLANELSALTVALRGARDREFAQRR
jgi:CBS domain-containing protein